MSKVIARKSKMRVCPCCAGRGWYKSEDIDMGKYIKSLPNPLRDRGLVRLLGDIKK